MTAPIAIALVFGGASLWAVPTAHAADAGMISVTFDDGWASQSDNALPILNKYAIPATMYIFSAAIGDTPNYMTQAQIQAFANRGDEIASHTVNHTDLTATTTTPAQVTTELSQSKTTLQGMFGPTAAIDFASPFGAYNATTTTAVKNYYATQRNTDGGFNAKTGFDPYNILVQNVDSTTTAATVQGWITSAKTDGTWLVLVYHEVGANIGGDIYNTPTATLDAHMAAVKNSGLALVTVRQGVQAMTGTTPPPPPPPGPPAEATAAINSVAAANPGLGAPSGDIVCGLTNGGCYRNYAAGAIIWSPATGAHYSVGAIRQVWAATGFERGGLGYPTSNEVGGLVNGGVYQNYQGGAIIWSPATGAHYTVGAIRQAWAATGFERGRLGYPLNNEYVSGSGVAQDYQGGRINWTSGGGTVVTYK